MKDSKKIIVLGVGGTSQDIVDLIEQTGNECVGFLDDDSSKHGSLINGVKVFGSLDQAKDHTDSFFVNGIGSPANFLLKEEILSKASIPADCFITLVHPSVVLSKTATIGSDCVIFPNCVIASNVKIGSHVVILPNSIVGHDSEIGDYTSLASGVCISGRVKVGKLCYLGSGSLVKEDTKIEDKSLVGMGSVVLEDIKEGRVYAGNPAKFLRTS